MSCSAHTVDEMATNFGMEDWTATHLKRKYKFAGKLARQIDDMWLKLVMLREPRGGFGRSRGGPITRWSNDLVKYAGGNWHTAALDEAMWKAAEEGYIARI